MDGSTRGGENHEAKKLVASRTVSRDKGGKEGQQDQSDLADQCIAAMIPTANRGK